MFQEYLASAKPLDTCTRVITSSTPIGNLPSAVVLSLGSWISQDTVVPIRRQSHFSTVIGALGAGAVAHLIGRKLTIMIALVVSVVAITFEMVVSSYKESSPGEKCIDNASHSPLRTFCSLSRS